MQQLLAIEQGYFREIEAFAIEQFEHEMAETIDLSGAQIGLQQRKAGQTGGIFDDDLAVEQPRT